MSTRSEAAPSFPYGADYGRQTNSARGSGEESTERLRAEDENEGQSGTHKRRMTELDNMRKLLEIRATEVETAYRNLEREKRKLHGEYEAKITELSDAKSRLEKQVVKMEAKESQLRTEWARFEEDKGAAVAEAEVRNKCLLRN
jgi:chromosome segregation ATPase